MAKVRQLEYLRVKVEDTAAVYGTAADMGSGTTGFPFDSYDVEPENDALELDKFTGDVDTVYIDNTMQTLGGRGSAQVFPDNSDVTGANSIFKLAGLIRVGTDSSQTYSFTVDHFNPADREGSAPANTAGFVRHVGVKCDVCRITCGMGNPKLMLEMDFIGGYETTFDGSASFVTVPSFPSQASFQLADASWIVGEGGGTEINVKEFSIEVRNNHSAGPPNSSRYIKWLDAGRKQVTVTFTVRRHTVDNATNPVDYRALVRSFHRDMAFKATFTRTSATPIQTVTFTCPDLVMVSARRVGGIGDHQDIEVTCKARDAGSAAGSGIVPASAVGTGSLWIGSVAPS